MAGITFNEDDSHFCYELDTLLDGREPTAELVAGFVDRYAGTGVRELVFCVNAQRTGFATEAWGWEPIWTELETGPAWWRDWPWPKNAKRLHDLGLDRFALMLGRCRQHDIAPWLSIRTNDYHAVDDLDSPMHSWFWKQHHDYWRVPDRFELPGDRALNYAVPEVRRRLLALVEEVSEKYDFDGLELDWLRTEYCLAPGREHQDAHLLTEMIRDVRTVLDRTAKPGGGRIDLGVRVPPLPQQPIAFGLDVIAWAREGLIQRIAPSPHIHLFPDLPVQLWRQLTADLDVLICPALDIRVQPHPRAPRRSAHGFFNSSSETARGAAAAFLHQGADRVYLFNHFCNGTNICDNTPALYAELLCELGDLESLSRRPRRHLVTQCDVVAPGQPRVSALPVDCGPQVVAPEVKFGLFPVESAGFSIWTGPVSGDHTVQVRLAFESAVEAAAAEVRVNRQRAAFSGELSPKPSPGPAEAMWAYDVAASALFEGSSLVEVRTAHATRVTWVELAILPV